MEQRENKTNLTLEPYLDLILEYAKTLDPITSLSRKPMMATKGTEDSHVFSRRDHVEEVSKIAKNIAKQIGANELLAETIGLLHDIGHADGGHQGERTLNQIGSLLNSGFYYHPAVGVDVLLEYNFIDRVLEKIKIADPSVANDKIKENKIREEIWYIFDGILSHDGEGVDRKIEPHKADGSIENYVRDNLRACYQGNGENKKVVPATLEAAIIRYADILAYTRSDQVDGLRLGLFKTFNIEQQKIIGKCIAYSRRKEDETCESIIKNEDRYVVKSKQMDMKIKEYEKQMKQLKLEGKAEQLRELRERRNALANKRNELERLHIQQEKIEIKMAKEFIKSEIDKYGFKDAIINITMFRQQVLINAVSEYSKGKEYICASPSMAETLFDLRSDNLSIVKYSRRDREKNLLPKAKLELVKSFAEVLLNTGIVYENMPEDLKANLIPERKLEDFEKERQELLEGKPIISSPKEAERRIIKYRGDIKNAKKLQLTENIEEYRKRLGKKAPVRKLDKQHEEKYNKYDKKVYLRFIKLCKNSPNIMKERMRQIYGAINGVVKDDVRKAEQTEEEFNKEAEAYIFKDKVEEKIIPIREAINNNNFTEEQRKELIEKITKDRRKDIERTIAYDFAIRYIFGTNDLSILEILLQKGIVTEKEIEEGKERDQQEDKGVARLADKWESCR